ncbi:N-6 DNA methylase [Candidatus Micrarchaeota archaeon]|nr:N-6 DNA methylase [Candidatus Micrarchaeota archaeon]
MNSFAKLVENVSDDSKLVKKNGAVYTPDNLAEYVAHKLVEYVEKDGQIKNKRSISIIDPAVGDGVLLEKVAVEIKKEIMKRDSIIFSGIDIDCNAIEASKNRLTELDSNQMKFRLLNSNALCPIKNTSLTSGWKTIFKKTGVTEGFDLLITNPPWGADLSEYKKQLRVADFKTLQGQFDSFELFMELALKIVKKGGYFAFIVPDSILNHEKSILRNVLIEKTEIRFIARLGEKLFPRVNRSCVVIICRNAPPKKLGQVDCFRLTSNDRNKILKGQLSFKESERKNIHIVPQQRFRNNDFQRFDIDLKETETNVIKKLKPANGRLDDVLTISRGVELSSSGKVFACNYCSLWMPLSEKPITNCPYCGKKINTATAKQETIVTNKKTKKSASLIRGGDLKRYSTSPSKYIELGFRGINYKEPELYRSPKIFIRKTGVGITAALDYSDSYTSQVVYIVKSKMELDDLEFYIGLLNSRAYYFYLIKAFGELEWRSHPYLTQSQIANLPLPNLKNKENIKIKNRITKLLRPILKNGKKPNDETDAKIEYFIAKLFSLTKKDYEIIFNAINESDELLPIRELKKIDTEEIFRKTM